MSKMKVMIQHNRNDTKKKKEKCSTSCSFVYCVSWLKLSFSLLYIWFPLSALILRLFIVYVAHNFVWMMPTDFFSLLSSLQQSFTFIYVLFGVMFHLAYICMRSPQLDYMPALVHGMRTERQLNWIFSNI